MFDKTNAQILRTKYLTRDLAKRAVQAALIQQGIVGAAKLGFATDASNADTIVIGGMTFKFLTTLIAADATTQVKRGTSAAATLADLVKAINGTADAAKVVQATTPFATTIVADAVGTSLRIRWADARGGNPIAGVPGSIALTSALTPGASIWNCDNLNVSGRDPGKSASACGGFTVEAAMVTAGYFDLELPFTPTFFSVNVTSSTGVLRSSNEAVTIVSNHLHFVMAGGGSPNLQAGDIVSVWAQE